MACPVKVLVEATGPDWDADVVGHVKFWAHCVSKAHDFDRPGVTFHGDDWHNLEIEIPGGPPVYNQMFSPIYGEKGFISIMFSATSIKHSAYYPR